MKGIINNIMIFYEMQAEALGILLINTQEALKELGRKSEVERQAKKLEDFAKDLIVDLNNTLTMFWFQREHRRMSDDRENALVDFVNFVKTLRVNAHSLLMRSRTCETFEERIDREIRDLEKQVKQKLKEFDEVLDETSNTWKKRLCRNVSNKVRSVGKYFGKKEIEQGESEEGRTDRSQTNRFEESCPGESIDSYNDRPERFFDALNANTPTVGCKKSECEIHLKKRV